jgi:hypothetical protein
VGFQRENKKYGEKDVRKCAENYDVVLKWRKGRGGNLCGRKGDVTFVTRHASSPFAKSPSASSVST